MAIDWDEVFSYQTIKMVVVRDRRLGIIHYLLQLIILAYIIFDIITGQRYLLAEPPYGSIRATTRQPEYWSNVTELPYCAQSQPAVNGYNNSNCVYLMGTDVSYPPGIINSVSVATRIKDTFVPLLNSNCSSLPSSLECAPNITRAPSTRFYTADPEYFTVYIEHSIFGEQNNIMTTNWDCKGFLKYRGKGRKQKELDHTKKEGDIFTLKELLDAAELQSLDVPSNGPGQGSLRYDGTLLVAVVNYQNIKNTDKFEYFYELYHIPGVDVISMQPSYLGPDGKTLIQRNFYGVRIVFIVTGKIGYFDFMTLLQAVVAAVVLLKLAAVAVDMLLLYIMPDRNTYKQHKFETTEDFGDIREKR